MAQARNSSINRFFLKELGQFCKSSTNFSQVDILFLNFSQGCSTGSSVLGV